MLLKMFTFYISALKISQILLPKCQFSVAKIDLSLMLNNYISTVKTIKISYDNVARHISTAKTQNSTLRFS